MVNITESSDSTIPIESFVESFFYLKHIKRNSKRDLCSKRSRKRDISTMSYAVGQIGEEDSVGRNRAMRILRRTRQREGYSSNTQTYEVEGKMLLGTPHRPVFGIGWEEYEASSKEEAEQIAKDMGTNPVYSVKLKIAQKLGEN